ncbi:DUF2330 domain-containing protein [candidate division WOR-3 bacterium]|nr:DUF2330 domain-containing protein [candidate division WOR-3 bacterium]
MKKYALFIIFMASLASADKGMIPISMPNISIYEPGQKAIIGWNGKKEIMILSVDARADTECKVLEILPLPSEPVVDSGSFESFKEVQKLIRKNAPKMEALFRGKALPGAVPGVELIFHKEIGPHNITCVKALKYQEFVDWALDFIKKQGVDTLSLPKELQGIIKKYLKSDIPYFVFDIIELSKDPKSVVPLIYEFESPYLFFPLQISRLARGNTRIQLFLITQHIPWQAAIQPFRIGKYQRMFGFRRDYSQDIIFKLTKEEIKQIEPSLTKLFRTDAYLTALEFEGSTNQLTTDLMLKKFCKIIEY